MQAKRAMTTGTGTDIRGRAIAAYQQEQAELAQEEKAKHAREAQQHVDILRSNVRSVLGVDYADQPEVRADGLTVEMTLDDLVVCEFTLPSYRPVVAVYLPCSTCTSGQVKIGRASCRERV